MKKLKNESGLFKEAMRVGTRYFVKRGAGEFDADDPMNLKVRMIYALLVKDGLIQPLAAHDESAENMRHKLALWINKQLPADHPLKQ